MVLSKEALLERISEAVAECGWNIAYLDDPPVHPFRLLVFTDTRDIRLRVYIWNLTHGGGPRAAAEYRIQVTGVPDGITGEHGFRNLILGYWQAGEVFAGFDFRRHNGPIGYSPSIQIREEALRLAYTQGFAPHNKGGGELAVAFRPDYFVDYCQNVEELHGFAASHRDVEALEQVAQESITVNDAVIDTATVARREVLRTVAAGHISVQFRRRVLSAYQHRCAMCGMQLNLVESAHIIPASYPSTSFETCNGVALCALHHKAFDEGLVAFNARYEVITNDGAFADLRDRHRAAGEPEFRASLRPFIHLPASVVDRPLAAFVDQGLVLRGWPDHLR